MQSICTIQVIAVVRSYIKEDVKNFIELCKMEMRKILSTSTIVIGPTKVVVLLNWLYVFIAERQGTYLAAYMVQKRKQVICYSSRERGHYSTDCLGKGQQPSKDPTKEHANSSTPNQQENGEA